MKKYKSAKVTGIIFAVLIFSLVVNILYLGATGETLDQWREHCLFCEK